MTPEAREAALDALRRARSFGYRGVGAITFATTQCAEMTAHTLIDRAASQVALDYAAAFRYLRMRRRRAYLHSAACRARRVS